MRELGPGLYTALSEDAGRWGVVESTTVEGNMCFMVIRHAGWL
jgi:hypothetical protein